MSDQDFLDFLDYKFFNLNYLIQNKYKVGDECNLQDIILDEIEWEALEIDGEFYEYKFLDTLDIVAVCAEYCRENERYKDFTKWMFYRKYHECTSYVLRNKVAEFFDDEENIDMLNKMINEYNDCIFKLAINKLKRNKLVNNGFLLKVSIMKCGMF
jgi:hypothetical protein